MVQNYNIKTKHVSVLPNCIMFGLFFEFFSFLLLVLYFSIDLRWNWVRSMPHGYGPQGLCTSLRWICVRFTIDCWPAWLCESDSKVPWPRVETRIPHTSGADGRSWQLLPRKPTAVLQTSAVPGIQLGNMMLLALVALKTSKRQQFELASSPGVTTAWPRDVA